MAGCNRPEPAGQRHHADFRKAAHFVCITREARTKSDVSKFLTGLSVRARYAVAAQHP